MNASRAYALAQFAILVAFAAIYFLDPTAPVFPAPFARSAGVVLCALGLLLMIVAIVTLRAVIRVEPEPKPGGFLVTSGVYGRFRHPIYTGMVVVTLGLVLMKPTPAVALAAVVLVTFLVVKTRFEERRLLARYPEYSEYRRRTWGVLPGF